MALGDTSTLDGYFKELYADTLSNTVPDFSILSKKVPFKLSERLGDSYHTPIRFSRGHGVTFATGATSLTAFALNDPVTGKIIDSTISGSSCVGREQFGYKALAAGREKGKAAFGDVMDEGVNDLWDTMHFYLELFLLYGSTSIGTFGGGGASSTSSQDIALTKATSAPGLWAQMEGAYIDVYTDIAYGTKRNASGTIIVSGVDYAEDTGIVTLSLTGSGAAEMDAIIAGDVIVPRGAASAQMAGLDKILTNTGSLFGISASTYKAWKANEYAVGGAALTFAKLMKAAAMVAVRHNTKGKGGGKLDALVSTSTWTDLNNNTVSLRRLANNSGGTVELGTEGLVYHGPTGPVEIMPSPMVKNGEAFLGGLTGNAKRIGASEPTFNLREAQNDKFLLEVAGYAGFEIRAFWDQGIFIPKPRGWAKLTGIVNSA